MLELVVGQNVLDVGSSFGFLPVLITTHMPEVRVIGWDNNADVLAISTDLVTAIESRRVSFMLQDILLPMNIDNKKRFDTVTALHVLEHLKEEELPVAFAHLLYLVSRRLIIAVPYEENAHSLYGHSQVFTHDKLHFWGRWCINTLGGAGKYWCEDIMGGMLIVERL